MNCDVCFERSFASHPKAIHWSYKNDKKPRHVFAKGDSEKYKFVCDICNHDFEMNCYSITAKNTWCPYCANQKLCETKHCQTCFEKSFASNSKAVYWSIKNTKTPREVLCGSDMKIQFDCETCKDSFTTRLANVSNGQWCPNCKHKTERKLYEYLLLQNIQTIRQANFDWCKNEETGKHLPFDFVIEDKRIIIEVDGLQHFEQVSNWRSPEETQSRDLLKMKLAQENGYTVIRIFQEDVLYDSYDWKTQLMNALIQYDSPTCLYMSKDENRYCQYQPTTP